ncbi:Mov34/MPN/PAD-1 family protein [Deinococcus altitudinis]|uniref:Mov34/MPN/PAD-1 family protein n=1 Tax=Deinococcus altitudinis TaxID=468914 RepID=UPI0038922739
MNPLRLPGHLQSALWAHVLRESPGEGVGVLAADTPGNLRAIYPLRNIDTRPLTRYLADPLELLRAFRAMERDHLTLGAIYHSHPNGPARPSETDLILAEYRVPYLIADVAGRVLRAYLLPENVEVPLLLG